MSTEVEPLFAPAKEVKEAKPESKVSHATVFVNKIPLTVSQQEFEEFFSVIGPIRLCFLVSDKTESGHRGMGYVRYALPQDSVKAVELNGSDFGGSKITVELALKRKPKTDEESVPAPVALPVDKPYLKKQPLASAATRVLVLKCLPEGVDKKQIYKKVRKFGTVELVEFPLAEMPGVARVTYTSLAESTLAQTKLHEHVFKGAKLECHFEEHVETKAARLIIRNLSFNCRPNHLQTVFEPFGNIIEVSIPSNAKSTTREGPLDVKPHKGFAFVQYAKIEEAQIAMDAVNGQSILGRTVAVDFALPKKTYDSLVQKETLPTEGEVDSDEEETEFDHVLEVDDKEETDEDAPIEDKVETVAWAKTDEGCTLFIRNLCFESTEENLKEMFSAFGTLKYAKVTMDKVLGRSRGSGFVCFEQKEDAEKCMDAYFRASQTAALTALPSEAPKRKEDQKKSQLIPELSKTAIQGEASFVLDGRFLNLSIAVSRDEASKLAHQGELSRRSTDKRNLYLLKEGAIWPESTAGKALPEAELEKRVASYSQRKRLLQSNPALFVSRTRLSLRSLSKTLDDAQLRKYALRGILAFYKEVEEGTREPVEKELIDEEIKQGMTEAGPKRWIHIVQGKIMREKDRVDPITKKCKSKGYGFLEFSNHVDALVCLRFLNNNPLAFNESLETSLDDEELNKLKRPMVEFAIENSVTLKRRNERAPGSKPDKYARNVDEKFEKSKDGNLKRKSDDSRPLSKNVNGDSKPFKKAKSDDSKPFKHAKSDNAKPLNKTEGAAKPSSKRDSDKTTDSKLSKKIQDSDKVEKKTKKEATPEARKKRKERKMARKSKKVVQVQPKPDFLSLVKNYSSAFRKEE